jgi:type IV pilus assembly protein PilC
VFMLSPAKFEWSHFARRLATLLEAGIPLVQSLEMMSLQVGKSTFQQEIWKRVKEQVEAGNDLSEALSLLKPSPNPFVLAMTKAGEYTGTLGKVLGEVADELDQEQVYRKKLKSTLAYPMILVFTVVIVLCVFSVWVLPMYGKLYEDMGAELPFLTRVIFASGRKLPILLGSVLVSASGVLLVMRFTDPGLWKMRLERSLIRLPLFGKIYCLRFLVHFSRVLERLLSAGIPLLEALCLTAGTLSTLHRYEMLELTNQLILNVRQGKRMAPLLRASRIFPTDGAEMIAVAEESGQLDRMLHYVAKMFRRELEDRLDRLTRMIEPILILVLAVLIGLVAAGVMLPAFDIGSHLK